MTRVAASSTRNSSTSQSSTSAWLPTDTQRLNPAPCEWPSETKVPINAPLWLAMPIPPGRSGPASSASEEESIARSVTLNTPRQFGPSSRIPAARATASTASCNAAPAGPASASLPVMTMHAPTPAAAHSSTCRSKDAAGTASTATSAGSGAAETEG